MSVCVTLPAAPFPGSASGAAADFSRAVEDTVLDLRHSRDGNRVDVGKFGFDVIGILE